MNFYTVEFVYSDEATPRDLNYRTVKAADGEDAKATVMTWAMINGDRIEGLALMTPGK